MAYYAELRRAVESVSDAETQLDEITALVALKALVNRATGLAIEAARGVHTPTEIARACGVSRQAISKRRPAA